MILVSGQFRHVVMIVSQTENFITFRPDGIDRTGTLSGDVAHFPVPFGFKILVGATISDKNENE